MVKTAMTGAIKNNASTRETSEGTTQFNPAVLFNNPRNSNSVHLTIHKLNGKNYVKWAQSIKLVIDGKGKLGHLTGEVKKPIVGDTNMKAWKSENSLIITWLINSMEPTIGKPFLFLPIAQDVWEAVHDTYSDFENSSQIFGLKSQL